LLLLFVVGVDDTAKQCGIAVLVDLMLLLSIVLVGSGTVLVALSMMITQMTLNRKQRRKE
jgi:hypothetical protein